jgi:DHA1 family tetracycline resistance protein-like MFS transporter
VRSPLIPIFLIVLVDVLGLTIILPLLPFYAESFGASPTVVGLLVSSYAACQLVSGPLLGRLSDQTGRKPLLIVSQIGTFLGFGLLAASTQLWMVFVARVIDGLTAGNLSLAQAYISDVTEPQNRTRAFGVIGVAFGLGFLVGPAVSGFLAQYSPQAPIYVAMGLSALSIAGTAFLLPGSKPGTEGGAGPGGRRLTLLAWGSYAEYFRRPGLARLLGQYFLFCFSFATFTSGFALFAERRFTWQGHAFGAREVGYVFAYVGGLGIILQGGLIGRLARWLGEHQLILVSFAAATLGYAFLGFTHAIGLLLGVAAVSSLGNGALRPALTTEITRQVDRREQGTVLGLMQSLLSVAQIVAPVIGGFLIDHRLLEAWALVAAGATLLGFMLTLGRPQVVPA